MYQFIKVIQKNLYLRLVLVINFNCIRLYKKYSKKNLTVKVNIQFKEKPVLELKAKRFLTHINKIRNIVDFL